MENTNKAYDMESIRRLLPTDADIDLLDFRPDSPYYVSMIGSRAGFLPDYSEERLRRIRSGENATAPGEGQKRAGIFADEMPQNIVTRVYNYRLNYIVLCGDESEEMIDNLHRTLVPDIVMEIEIVRMKNEE